MQKRASLLALTLLIAPTWARAQEADRAPVGTAPTAEPVVAEAPAEGAVVSTPATDVAAPAEAASAGVTDESIYVIQRRAYSKKGSFEVTPLFFTSLNNKFVGNLGLGFSAAYHLRENLAVEIMTSLPFLMYSFYSGLVYELYDKESLTPEVVDLKQLRYWGAASLDFSALYGKFELYGIMLDYDFYATAGFGLATTVETCTPPGEGECGEASDTGVGRGLQAPAEQWDRLKIAGSLGGGMRIFFSDNLGLRLEMRDVVYSDRAAEAGAITTDIRNNVFFIAGVSFLL